MTASAPTISVGQNFAFAEANLTPGPAPATFEPPLGVLENFTGTYAGKGFNTIFRPNNKGKTTVFPKPVTPTPPQPPSESVLELNLTTETLTFSASLGSVPNRGLGDQDDIFLNGVSYVQTVNDVTNIATGKADDQPQPIHFEPGLWMNVPATNSNPVIGNTLVRMASIPHGTTINAQGLAPQFFKGSPINGIKAADITPFPIGGTPGPGLKNVFIALNAANTDSPRLPQDLTKFIQNKTITQDMINDPNSVLRDAIKDQTILDFSVFTVSTAPLKPKQADGIANISFLEGDTTAPIGPNANAAQMTAIFWVETVQYTIVVPVFTPGQPPLKLSPTPVHPGDPVPVFLVHPPHAITAPKKIVVTAKQIQYSQNVTLNFQTLSWPHVSVATLVPTDPQPVPDSVWN